jgi:hypothetical protein
MAASEPSISSLPVQTQSIKSKPSLACRHLAIAMPSISRDKVHLRRAGPLLRMLWSKDDQA